MKKERLNAITDGVFAIIITIMILEIKIPELTVENISSIVQSIFIYLVSFVLIAILWINHHHMFSKHENVSIHLVWLNFLLMFATSFIPAATERINEEFYQPSAHVFYGAVLGTTTLLYALIQYRSLKEMNISVNGFSNMVNWASTLLFYSAMLLCFVSVYISSGIYILIPAFYLYHTFNPIKIEK